MRLSMTCTASLCARILTTHPLCNKRSRGRLDIYGQYQSQGNEVHEEDEQAKLMASAVTCLFTVCTQTRLVTSAVCDTHAWSIGQIRSKKCKNESLLPQNFIKMAHSIALSREVHGPSPSS